METKKQFQAKIDELTRQWQVLDKTLAELRTTRILETRKPEQQRLIEQSRAIEQERHRIEQELEQIEREFHQAAPAPTVLSADALRDAYLTWLCQKVSLVSLAGIDRKAARREIDACLQLSAIYTALLTTGAEQETNLKPELQEQKQRGQFRERPEPRLSALAQVNQHQRLVLLGEPGSGKSTFVNFMALCLAGELVSEGQSERFPSREGSGVGYPNLALLTAPLPIEADEDKQKPQPWDHGALLPVRVILRDFAARGLPPADQLATVEHLWQFIAQELTEAALGDYVPHLRRHLETEGGLLLLDGLDEVPEAEARRIQMKQVVEEFARVFPRCRVLVTSRTYAYQKQAWRLPQFAETVLAPFTAEQIRYFVDRWYQHVGFLRGMHPEDVQGRAKLLQEAIFRSDRLQSFAARPLLLTLMASLHAWRGGSLPDKREELYNDAVDLLLDWWESSKVVRDPEGRPRVQQESLAELLNVGKDGIRQALNRLAFQSHASQAQLAGTADIAEQDLVSGLMDLSQNRELQPVRLIEFLSDRAGLLIPHGVGVYTFPHRTFQEYLTACHLTDQDDYPENVAELARRDPNRWREVVLLAGARVARTSAGSIWNLAEALCYQNLEQKHSPPENAWGALLAGQALAESANLQQISPRNLPKRDRIRQWLVAILTEQTPFDSAQGDRVAPLPAVERALAGNLLAQLGDPRSGVGLREDGLPDIRWCDVPAGTFLMGSTKKDKEAFNREQPQHKVTVSAFQISRYPVTNAQYRAFVEDGGYTAKEYWDAEGWKWKAQNKVAGPETYGGWFDLPNHPVVGVSWYEAAAFCNWLTKKTHPLAPSLLLAQKRGGELTPSDSPSLREERGPGGEFLIRLPTEAEWEYAARGTDGRIYPWGNKITTEHANYAATGLGATSAVGCFPSGMSPYNCEDMSGNVWEWCVDVWHDNYKGAPTDGRAWEEGEDINLRLLRGGSGWDDPKLLRCAYRSWDGRDFQDGDGGFRLVRAASGQ